jgi:E3 ubiquitin-protein ligase HUWE1
MSSCSCFATPFLENLSDPLLLTVLKPKFRLSQQLLKNTSQIFGGLETLVPGRSLHLISMMLLSGDDCLTAALMTYSKLSDADKRTILSSIQVAFDRVVSKSLERDVHSKTIETYVNVLPELVIARRSDFLAILGKLLAKFDMQNSGVVCELFRILSPPLLPDLPRSAEIPADVVAASPEFWRLVLRYKSVISQIISANPATLEKAFSFARVFAFLLDFPIKFRIFQEKIKERQNRRRLRLYIRRSQVIEDSYAQLRFVDQQTFLGEFAVTFVDEPAVDAGGVRRDWFTTLMTSLFNPEYALFTAERIPSPSSSIVRDHVNLFQFGGKMIAKAVFDGVNLPIHLPVFMCKEILGVPISLSDFEGDPAYSSLQWILENDPEDCGIFFVADDDNLGRHTVVPLVPRGDQIPVTTKNRAKYVQLLVRYRLVGRIEEQLRAFVKGFQSIISESELRMFAPNELDLIICGIPVIDVKDLKVHCRYVFPLNQDHPLVLRFFAVIRHWQMEDLAKLLLFATGSSQVPVGGFKAFADAGVPFSLAAGGDKERLPVAHTCINTLDLPAYGSEMELNAKLRLAITECNTFGFV